MELRYLHFEFYSHTTGHSANYSAVLLLMFGYVAGYKFGLFRELYYEQKPGEVFYPEHYNNMQMSENFINGGKIHWYRDLTNI
jgi:hypothetical protein